MSAREVSHTVAYDQLFERCVTMDFPLLPAPHWPQEPAYVAYLIDGLMKRNQALTEALKALYTAVERSDPRPGDRQWREQVMENARIVLES